MKPTIQKRTLVSSGVQEQAPFGISNADQAHIMRILRDQLYSDRILAVLREYASNAWDANRAAGRGDVPIEVDLPSVFQPYLAIRDSGPGLSQDEVFRIYTQYGASTKRDSDEEVGMLGIGSKSAFSYTTSFTVSSWHGGTKKVYNATLDEQDIGVIQLMHEEECDPSRTGIEVKVPIKKDDFNDFLQRARHLFPYFDPLPKFNTDIHMGDDTTRVPFKNGFLISANTRYYDSADSVGVLGCIPYRISRTVITDALRDIPLFYQHHYKGYGLRFDIGEVDFSANREELKYTDRTKAAIKNRLQALAGEVIDRASEMWNNPTLSQWEKKLQLEEFVTGGITVRTLYSHLGLTWGREDPIDTKSLKSFKPRFNHVPIERRHYFVIRDDNRAIKGFGLPTHIYRPNEGCSSYLVAPEKGFTVKDVQKELEELLVTLKMEGAPIKMLSSFTWTQPPVTPRTSNPKHNRKEFVYKSCSSDKHSDNWEVESFVPSDADVFVILDKFIPESVPRYVKVFEADKELAVLAGIDFPKVRGYKNTTKKPLTPSMLKGTEYTEWQKSFHKKVADAPKAKEVFNHKAWFDRLSGYQMDYRLKRTRDALLKAGLTSDHQVIKFIEKGIDVLKSPLSKRKESLYHIPAGFVSDLEAEETRLRKDYPLLLDSWHDSFRMWDLNAADWVEYFDLKDAKRKEKGQ